MRHRIIIFDAQISVHALVRNCIVHAQQMANPAFGLGDGVRSLVYKRPKHRLAKRFQLSFNPFAA
jgi:hypothetical protein